MKRKKWRKKTSSGRTRSELQCSLPYQYSRVVLVGEGNCFLPVNKEEGEKQEKEVEEENQG